ncbi:MAG: hypothetical protein QG670_2606 [Thermoproteota archaeon]|nr:hypothetical protein [Thermoproteota archaeon]
MKMIIPKNEHTEHLEASNSTKNKVDAENKKSEGYSNLKYFIDIFQRHLYIKQTIKIKEKTFITKAKDGIEEK